MSQSKRFFLIVLTNLGVFASAPILALVAPAIAVTQTSRIGEPETYERLRNSIKQGYLEDADATIEELIRLAPNNKQHIRSVVYFINEQNLDSNAIRADNRAVPSIWAFRLKWLKYLQTNNISANAEDYYEISTCHLHLNNASDAERFSNTAMYLKPSTEQLFNILVMNTQANVELRELGRASANLSKLKPVIQALYTTKTYVRNNFKLHSSMLGNAMPSLVEFKSAADIAYRLKLHHLELDFCKRAIALDPQFDEPYARSARTYWFIDQHSTALSEINKSIARNPNNYAHYEMRASIFTSLGDVQKSIPDYKQAVRLLEEKASTSSLNELESLKLRHMKKMLKLHEDFYGL